MPLELLPDLADQFKPVFSSEEDFEQYRADYLQEMEQVLEEQRRARIASEEAVRKKVVC